MPRPKIDDSQRQRVAEACGFCRDLKKRCSGVAPCTQCLGRGIAQQCRMTSLPRGHRTKVGSRLGTGRDPARLRSEPSAPSRTLAMKTNATDCPTQSCRPTVSDLEVADTDVFPLPSTLDSGVEEIGQETKPSEQSITVQVDSSLTNEVVDPSLRVNGPRMLCTDRGEPVFIGGAASISFLETVRQVVTKHIGPSSFSHNEGSGIMLETTSPQARAKSVISNGMAENIEQISASRKGDYVQCYFDVTEALLDAFEPFEVRTLLNLDNTDANNVEPSPMIKGCLDMVLAIGAQCSRGPGDAEIGRAYLRRAQIQVFSGFIEDPDIDVVRLFLLMAFYMLGESRRNTAYMYLSIATRGALALGLHIRESYENTTSADLKARLRIRLWLTARIMDQLTNAILGRPAVTVAIRSNLEDVIERLLPSEENPRIASLTVCSDIVSIINQIDEGLYNGNDVSPSMMERYLQDIDAWKQKLPQAIENIPMGATGKLHISCLYYFAVTQASRPAFLLSLSTVQSGNDVDRSPMATACYEAAGYLSQACADAWKASLLRGNMCILKALVFAAGLVLGVEDFAQGNVSLEVEQAFQSAKEVLTYFSTQSPQAAHYLDILASLSTAIATRRSRSKSTGPSHYVSKLFNLSPSFSVDPTTTAGAKLEWETLGMSDEAAAARTVISEGNRVTAPEACPQVQAEFPDFDIDWQSLNISQWDSFPFLSETLA